MHKAIFSIIILFLFSGLNAQKDSILLTNTKVCFFSNSSKKDLFKIEVKGNELVEGVATFQIQSKEKMIWEEKFPVMDFFGFEISGNETKEQLEKMIIEKVDTFFEDKYFLKPAINKKEINNEENIINKENWMLIKKQKKTIGFSYNLRKADGKSIAYCKKLRKIIVYSSCC